MVTETARTNIAVVVVTFRKRGTTAERAIRVKRASSTRRRRPTGKSYNPLVKHTAIIILESGVALFIRATTAASIKEHATNEHERKDSHGRSHRGRTAVG